MNFDAVAGGYARLEWLVYGRALQAARCAHLESLDLPSEAKVLLLGEGDGRFLEELVRTAPGIRVDVVEASEAMVRRARQRVGGAGNVRWFRVPAESYEPDASYHLLVTHFFLDLFSGAKWEGIMARAHGWLKPDGEWWLADFHLPDDPAVRSWWQESMLGAMYGFFRMTAGVAHSRLEDPEPWLRARGCTVRHRVESWGGFIRSDRWCRNGQGGSERSVALSRGAR